MNVNLTFMDSLPGLFLYIVKDVDDKSITTMILSSIYCDMIITTSKTISMYYSKSIEIMRKHLHQ